MYWPEKKSDVTKGAVFGLGMKFMPGLTDGKIESCAAVGREANVSTIFHFALFHGFEDVSKAISRKLPSCAKQPPR